MRMAVRSVASKLGKLYKWFPVKHKCGSLLLGHSGQDLSYSKLCQLRRVHTSRTLCLSKHHSDFDNDNEEYGEDIWRTNDAGDEIVDDPVHHEFVRDYYSIPDSGQRLLVIQPEIKWGPQKEKLTTAELQLAEACALVDTLPNWKVVDKMICKVKSLTTKYMFGKGNLEELTAKMRTNPNLSGVFLSTNMLSGSQLTTLQDLWGVPIYDRYMVVLHIFKEHARTKEAKLQVALAEIPHLRSRLKALHEGTIDRPSGGMQHMGGSGETFIEIRHRLLQERELKLRKIIGKVKIQRSLLRANREKKGLPVVAVVGYTNAGKTSLIKALTGDVGLQPRHQLFATLDVTAHAGSLPSHMTVLYVDTVGFMSNIPTSLIDAFSATLEDALVADAIIHIRDISHPDTISQRHNVITTLQGMLAEEQLQSVIEVCNKSDLLPEDKLPQDGMLISARTGQGLSYLQHQIEAAVIKGTGKSVRYLKVPQQGSHLSWLYREATVRATQPSEDGKHLVAEVIISEASYAKFKAQFGRPKSKHR